MITNKKMLVSASTDPIEKHEDVIKYVKELQDSKCDFLHCDVMDGVFVGKKTYGYGFLNHINLHSVIPLDVHLMIYSPEYSIKEYVKSGANIITIHYEAFNSRKKLIKCLKEIKKNNVMAGLAISPRTEIHNVIDCLGYCDVVLLMSVFPGKSGQVFIEETYLRLKLLNKMREKFKFNFMIEVDGGVTPEIGDKLKEMGADILVSGSYLYDSENKRKAINLLKCVY